MPYTFWWHAIYYHRILCYKALFEKATKNVCLGAELLILFDIRVFVLRQASSFRTTYENNSFHRDLNVLY